MSRFRGPSTKRLHATLGDGAMAWRRLAPEAPVAAYLHAFGVTHLLAAWREADAAALVVDFEGLLARRHARSDGGLMRHDLPTGCQEFLWADPATGCAIDVSDAGVLQVTLHVHDPVTGAWRSLALEPVRIPEDWRANIDPGLATRVIRRRDADGDWCLVWFEAEWVICWDATTGARFAPEVFVGHESQVPAWFRSQGDALALGDLRLTVDGDGTIAALATVDRAFPAWQGQDTIDPEALLADGTAVVRHGKDMLLLRPAGAPISGRPALGAAQGASFAVESLGASRLA
jgi:hypothetical protein